MYAIRSYYVQKAANDDRLLIKEFGKLRAEKIRLRLTQLKDALTLEDVRYLAGNYHELINNRKGQWACDLDQPYRLIFVPHENPIPTDEDGRYRITSYNVCYTKLLRENDNGIKEFEKEHGRKPT